MVTVRSLRWKNNFEENIFLEGESFSVNPPTTIVKKVVPSYIIDRAKHLLIFPNSRKIFAYDFAVLVNTLRDGEKLKKFKAYLKHSRHNTYYVLSIFEKLF